MGERVAVGEGARGRRVGIFVFRMGEELGFRYGRFLFIS